MVNGNAAIGVEKADFAKAERVVLRAGRSGYFYGTGSAVTVFSQTIPGGTIKPGALLHFIGTAAKFTPNNGGWSVGVKLTQGANSVTLGTNAIAATLATYTFEHQVAISDDRKWGYPRSVTINMHNTASIAAAGLSDNFASATAMASKSARAKSGAIAFASYSASPTVETILFNFDQDITLTVILQAVSGDCVELIDFEFAINAASPVTANPTGKSTLIMGDSVTEGTGATTFETSYTAMFGKTRTGRPIIADGLGGQVSSLIADRFLAYGTAARYWDLIVFTGINDVSTDGPTWWNAVNTALQRMLAARAPGSKTIICNLYQTLNWSGAQITAMQYVNSQLAATYGSLVADLYTAMGGASPGANISGDNTHPNDTGHNLIAGAINTTATSLGWA